MNQSNLKRFAMWARKELLSHAENEETAYEWFFRLIAVRFMEVNDYLPTDSFVHQCNRLHEMFPQLFEEHDKIDRHVPQEIIVRFQTEIEEDAFRNRPQILGWLYQHYNTEIKEETFALLKKKNVKITQERLPNVTQLFTPEWIACYLVENSLGRFWLESHPNQDLQTSWRYYQADQRTEKHSEKRLIEDTLLIDPCMGSGHILLYAFDVFMQIYKQQGYSESTAAKAILCNNLYGLDIDKRAWQLAFFSLLMKARQYAPDIFTANIVPQVYVPLDDEEGEHYGSLLRVEHPTNHFRRLLSHQYDIVVTNPPYLSIGGMNPEWAAFAKQHYPNSKNDLFAMFIEKCMELTKENGLQAMITQHTWMFLACFETLRRDILSRDLIHMVHLGTRAFPEIKGEIVQATMFVLRKSAPKSESVFVRLTAFDDAAQKEEIYLNTITNEDSRYLYRVDTKRFTKIPLAPLAYWVGQDCITCYEKATLFNGITKKGILTGNDALFTRLWHEVSLDKIGFHLTSHEDMLASGKKWFPATSGGGARKWYGNFQTVVNLENDAEAIRASANHHCLRNPSFYMKESITWTEISSKIFSARFVPQGILFGNGGPTSFSGEDTLFHLALLNSNVTAEMLSFLAPTMNCGPKQIKRLPYIHSDNPKIPLLVEDCIRIAKHDWDSFERSWDFQRHPLLAFSEHSLEAAFLAWQCFSEKQFCQLKANEEELNRILMQLYGLHALSWQVLDKNVTVSRVYASKESIPKTMKGSRYTLTKADIAKSFLSYAVGCIFGRYSLDSKGIAYAGGSWNARKYRRFVPVQDNRILLCAKEQGTLDLTEYVIAFVKELYGEDSLENNLQFIADALNTKKDRSPRKALRTYFGKHFFLDHCKTYRNRPIYMILDDHMIYMHREVVEKKKRL